VNSVPRHRLFVEAALAQGAAVALAPEQAHRLLHVLRAVRGDAVALFNGRDGEWRAAIEGFGKERCRLRVETRRRAPGAPEPDLWLLFAPVKRAAIDLVVEKATELGVSRLLPVLTRHTDVARVNLERLAAIAVEAAGQCERLTVPEVAPPAPLFDSLAAWPAGRPLLVCAEAGAARPIAAVAQALPPGPAALLVGPEGGFSTTELDELARRPFVHRVGLGPRVLRAETAAIAAVACWQALRGDWTVSGGAGGEAADVRPPFRAEPSSSSSQP